MHHRNLPVFVCLCSYHQIYCPVAMSSLRDQVQCSNRLLGLCHEQVPSSRHLEWPAGCRPGLELRRLWSNREFHRVGSLGWPEGRNASHDTKKFVVFSMTTLGEMDNKTAWVSERCRERCSVLPWMPRLPSEHGLRVFAALLG